MTGKYYVYCPTRQKPTYLHSSFASANQEAHRLASHNPSEEFHVLEVKETVKTDPPRRPYKGSDLRTTAWVRKPSHPQRAAMIIGYSEDHFSYSTGGAMGDPSYPQRYIASASFKDAMQQGWEISFDNNYWESMSISEDPFDDIPF